MASNSDMSLFGIDLDGDSKTTFADDMLMMHIIEECENSKNDDDSLFSFSRQRRAYRKAKRSEAFNANLQLQLTEKAEREFHTLSETAQTIFDENGTTVKTGRQAVAELIAAFSFLSLAKSETTPVEKAGFFGTMTACCRAADDTAAQRTDIFSENAETAQRYYNALVYENMALLLKGNAAGSKAVEAFLSGFYGLLKVVQARAAAEMQNTRVEITPEEQFFGCMLLCLRKKQPEAEYPSEKKENLLEARVFRQILKRRRNSLFSAFVLATVVFLVLSVLPCLFIRAFFSPLELEGDLSFAMLSLTVFVGIPLAFIAFFAFACFGAPVKEYKKYSDAKKAYRKKYK